MNKLSDTQEFTRDEIKKELSSARYRRRKKNRCYVVLSLAEAETIKRIIQSRTGKGGGIIDGKSISMALSFLNGNTHSVMESIEVEEEKEFSFGIGKDFLKAPVTLPLVPMFRS